MPSPASVETESGFKMNSSRFALCAHIETGPFAVITMKEHAWIRSASRAVASMKFWTKKDSLCTRPLDAMRSCRIFHSMRPAKRSACQAKPGWRRTSDSRAETARRGSRRSSITCWKSVRNRLKNSGSSFKS